MNVELNLGELELIVEALKAQPKLALGSATELFFLAGWGVIQ